MSTQINAIGLVQHVEAITGIPHPVRAAESSAVYLDRLAGECGEYAHSLWETERELRQMETELNGKKISLKNIANHLHNSPETFSLPQLHQRLEKLIGQAQCRAEALAGVDAARREAEVARRAFAHLQNQLAGIDQELAFLEQQLAQVRSRKHAMIDRARHAEVRLFTIGREVQEAVNLAASIPDPTEEIEEVRGRIRLAHKHVAMVQEAMALNEQVHDLDRAVMFASQEVEHKRNMLDRLRQLQQQYGGHEAPTLR